MAAIRGGEQRGFFIVVLREKSDALLHGNPYIHCFARIIPGLTEKVEGHGMRRGVMDEFIGRVLQGMPKESVYMGKSKIGIPVGWWVPEVFRDADDAVRVAESPLFRNHLGEIPDFSERGEVRIVQFGYSFECLGRKIIVPEVG